MIALALMGCGPGLVTIKVEDTVSTEVEEGTILEEFIGDMGFDEFLDMDITESAALSNQGVEPGDIKSVRFTAFDLTAAAPAGADLSFITSMSLFVESDGLERRRIASASDFPVGEATVVFDLDDLDLTPYAVSQSMTITTEVEGHRPDDTTTVDAHYAIDVGVTAKGIVGEI